MCHCVGAITQAIEWAASIDFIMIRPPTLRRIESFLLENHDPIIDQAALVDIDCCVCLRVFAGAPR